MENELVAAWRRNCALNLLLLDSLDDAALEARTAPRTRTVAAQFAHVHGVRVHHLQSRGKRHLGKLRSFPRGARPTGKEIRKALLSSDEPIAALLSEFSEKGKVPFWKGPPATWLAYLCAHEAHHRGLAMASLRVSGVKVPREIQYGLWAAWGK
jgi:uncharacterized damage-inducible protein DinB